MRHTSQTSQNKLAPRPPIVVVMGHVDHGKTAILDFIRKTKVVEKEAGGITQHIGAYEIEVDTKKNETRQNSAEQNSGGQARKITFIDTPGHEAFSKMRSRGAKVADIAVLVVAADEGFKPQTKEALQMIKNEKMPYIVALNKIDKPNANPEIAKKQCAENEVFIEEWGGKTPLVQLSAKTGQGIDELLEIILLIADLEEFSADPALNASGVVIESHRDSRRGDTATLIIQNGTLKKGMFVAAGNALASTKILEDFLGRPVAEATFSSPILLAGFNKPPSVGAIFQSFNSKREAENYLTVKERERTEPEEQSKLEDATSKETVAEIQPVRNTAFHLSQDMHSERNNSGEGSKEVHLILKADTAGSLEALEGEIEKLSAAASESVKIEILSAKIGEINEEDIKLASSGENAIIVGFHVSLGSNTLSLAKKLSVTLQTFDVIYKLVDWLKEEIEKRLPAEIQKESVGKAEILKVFKKTPTKQIIGGRVLSGKIIKDGYFRTNERNGKTKFFSFPSREENESISFEATGKILELEQDKVKTDEVREGKQFGAMIETKEEVKKGDTLEIIEYKILKKKIY